jgi:AcrR family transcriptional regulator
MRTSKRDRILDAAVNVINRDGVRAVTFESVAAEAKLTRGGLLYHFPSREALLRGIDEQVQAWEASMETLLGKRARSLGTGALPDLRACLGAERHPCRTDVHARIGRPGRR